PRDLEAAQGAVQAEPAIVHDDPGERVARHEVGAPSAQKEQQEGRPGRGPGGDRVERPPFQAGRPQGEQGERRGRVSDQPDGAAAQDEGGQRGDRRRRAVRDRAHAGCLRSSRQEASARVRTLSRLPSRTAPAAFLCPPPPKRAASRLTSRSPLLRNESLVSWPGSSLNSTATRTPSIARSSLTMSEVSSDSASQARTCSRVRVTQASCPPSSCRSPASAVPASRTRAGLLR